jgi:enoyl-CoA hydratase
VQERISKALQDGIAILTLSHGKANALDLELCRELREAISETSKSADALVLTGRGSIFSAGVDLKRILSEPPAYIEEFFPALCDLFEEAFFCRRPLVAALNGHAIAGGCILCCASDYRVVGRGDARLGVPELLVGVPFPHVALEILRTCLEPARFRALLFRGFLVDPETGIADGIVDEIVEPEDVIPTALRVAAELGSLSAETFTISKMQIRAHAQARLAELSATEKDRVLAAWLAPETREAIRDYVDRKLR